jgi:uncharacterized integral membrane protein
VRRSLLASLVASALVAVAYDVPTWTSGLGLLARFVGALVVGVIVYTLVVVVLRRRVRRTYAKSARLERF